MGRKRNSDLTRQDILNAAHEEFCERGFEGARVDSIAAKAGANKRLLYHYFGNKEDLYRIVLLGAYKTIRAGERELSLDQYSPQVAMDRLVRFTFRHFQQNPWFLRLLTTENLNYARFLKTLPEVKELHSPLVAQIRTIIVRGAETGVFRKDVDPIQLYISIAALGYFYISNIHTLSIIFDKDFLQLAMIQEREAHVVSMVMDFLRTRDPSDLDQT